MTADPSRTTESLSADEWETVKDMVFSCLPLDRPARTRWLDERSPPERVRREVERLLAAAQTTATFMEVPAPQRVLETPAKQPERIGHFRIDHVLGTGGMGVVYAAVDERLGRQVAIKVLQPDAAVDETRRKRLLWDARAASVLNHPNIVSVYEAGEADGVEYVAMELVSGTTLEDLLDREAMPQARVLGLAVQIAAALEAAHAQGIVHRDLKPSNVMITAAGTAKLVDFGIAKSLGGDIGDGHAPTTIEGRVAGTVAYMSPEQAEGADMDFRSDIFSFGSLLYEMLTRRRAFSGGSTVSILARVIHAEPPAPVAVSPMIDPRLDDIIQRCLRKDRERRFQSMAEVRVRLQEVIDEPTPKAWMRARRGSYVWKAALIVAASIVIGAVAMGAMMRWGRPAVVPATLSRLTWDGGLTTAPAISRDATLLAYASDRSGRGDLDIWLQKIGGSDPIRLTTDTADDSAPAISPNGTQIAYRSERNPGGVYVTSLGGSERLLAPGCRDPKYSPDGKTIACWTGAVGAELYPGSGRIWLVSASGGPLRQFRPDFQAAAYPLWLPDGSGLVFVGRNREAGGASVPPDWWAAAENGDARPVGALRVMKDAGLLPPADGFYLRPEAWLEQPATVLFTAKREDATSVWGVDLSVRGDLLSDPRPMTLGAAVEALPTAPGASVPPEIVFASLSVESRLRRVPLLSNEPHAAAQPLLPNLSQIGSPSISADGRLLVFSARQPNGYRVVAVDLATAEQRLVTTVESSEFVRVLLSGDGKTIVYGGAKRIGYRLSLGSGLPEAICNGCGWPTHLNHDGSEALFESKRSDELLLIWSGGTVRPLIGGSDSANRMQFAGRFSPDGRWVALCAGARESSAREIFVVPNSRGRAVPDDQWIPISEGQTTDREPYWAPDGKRLFFISERDGFRCVWGRPMDPATGRPTGPAYPVAHFHHARQLLRSPVPSWSAIGLTASADSLIFTIAESTGNLWWRHGDAAR